MLYTVSTQHVNIVIKCMQYYYIDVLCTGGIQYIIQIVLYWPDDDRLLSKHVATV